MLAIFSALKEEVKAVISEMEVKETVHLRPAVILRGDHLGKELIVAHTGVGVDKMHRAVRFCAEEYRPDTYINAGFCGALSPNAALGEAVVATTIICEKKGEEAVSTDPALSDRLFGLCESHDIKATRGGLLTVDKVISTPHEKAFFGTKFGAVAVDMESYGFAAAVPAGAPFAVVRVILDPMDVHLPDFEGLVDEGGSSSAPRILACAVRHPKKAWHLPQMAYCASKAGETLRRFLNEVIKTI
jgi:nucleoside phosphorylase